MFSTVIGEVFSIDFLPKLFDDIIGNTVLCVACIFMLSYLRKSPPVFKIKKMICAEVILAFGAFLSRSISHWFSPKVEIGEPPMFQQALSHFIYNMRYGDLSPDEKTSFALEISSSIIGVVCICAGAFILMNTFKLRHIMPMVAVQFSGLILKELIKGPYAKFIKHFYLKDKPFKVEFCGYNGFAYGSFMIIIIILYIIVTKKKYGFFQRKNNNKFKYIALPIIENFLLLIIVICAYTQLVVYYSWLVGDIENGTIIPGIFSLLINFALFFTWLLITLLNYSTTCVQFTNDYNEFKRKEKVNLYTISQIINEATIKYLHDLPKHLRAIDSMAIKIGAKDISQYIHELEDDILEAKGDFSTGNSYLDGILAEEFGIAQQKGINIVFAGVFPEEGIKIKDITTVFMNLIDNAIEACEKVSGKREILISSKINGNRVYLVFSNPFEHKIKSFNGKLETTKKNKSFHGYGMTNVARVVKKYEYDGAFFTKQEDNIFTASVNMKFRQ